MNFGESFKSSLNSILANKMRSFLTMLGIIIGISSVITIVSIGQGGKKYISNQFQDIGSNIINVRVKAANKDIKDSDYFTMSDVKLIMEKIPEVDFASPINYDYGRAVNGTVIKDCQVIGITEYYKKVIGAKVLEGRFVNTHDVETQRNVAVIDNLTQKKFFPRTDPIGQKLKIKVSDKSMNVVIVGVIKNPDGDMAAQYGDNYPALAYIPITSCDRIMTSGNIDTMNVQLRNMKNSNEVGKKIVRFLEFKHKVTGIYTAEEGFKQVEELNKVLDMITTVIGAIAAISLLVGGIGVMNIMLVSVTERTREIGIRKALGAKQKDIRIQFLSESLILCLIGGSIGMILGTVFGMIGGSLMKVGAVTSPFVVAIAFLFSSAVGIFFGIYPANQAAKLDPIEALRYE